MLFLYTGFYSLLPVLPLYIEQLGAAPWQIGIMIGLYTLSAVICRPLVGRLLDRNGRKTYLLLGIIFFAFFTVSYIWMTSLAWLIVLRIAHGASWGLVNTALGTAIADSIPEGRKGEGMGWYGLSMTIAMAAGPLLAAWLLRNGSSAGLFLAAGLISAVPLLAALALPQPARPATRRDARPVWSRELASSLVVIALLAFSFGGVTTYMPLYAASLGADTSMFFLIYASALSLARPLSARWIDRKGNKLIAGALVLVVLSLLILASARDAVGISLAAALYGFGFGMAQPALQTLVLRLTGPERSGSANALFFTAFDIGIGVGSVALGLAAAALGYDGLFGLCAIVVLCGFYLFLRARTAWAAASRM